MRVRASGAPASSIIGVLQIFFLRCWAILSHLHFFRGHRQEQLERDVHGDFEGGVSIEREDTKVHVAAVQASRKDRGADRYALVLGLILSARLGTEERGGKVGRVGEPNATTESKSTNRHVAEDPVPEPGEELRRFAEKKDAIRRGRPEYNTLPFVQGQLRDGLEHGRCDRRRVSVRLERAGRETNSMTTSTPQVQRA